MNTWNIAVTDHGEKPTHNVPARFVVKATNTQTGRIVYGLGDTEREARQSAYSQMEAKVKA